MSRDVKGDIGMMFDVIINVIAVLLLLSCAIIFHEIGHLYYFSKYLGKQVKLRFEKGLLLVGYEKDYVGYTPKQYFQIYLYGIAFGLIPIGISMLLGIVPKRLLLAIVISYIGGCSYDLINMWRYGIRKKEWVV